MTGDAKHKKKFKEHTGWIKDPIFITGIPERRILGTIKERNTWWDESFHTVEI